MKWRNFKNIEILLLLLFGMLSFAGCGVLLHKSISIESDKREHTVGFVYNQNNIEYNLFFTQCDSTLQSNGYFHIKPYNTDDRKDIYIFIGTLKTELDTLPIRPFKIYNKKVDNKEFLVYRYGVRHIFLDFESRIYQYMNVYICEGKVVMMKGRVYNE